LNGVPGTPPSSLGLDHVMRARSVKSSATSSQRLEPAVDRVFQRLWIPGSHTFFCPRAAGSRGLVGMTEASYDNRSELDRLLRRAAAGAPEAWRALLEQLSNSEAARALGLSTPAASKRYVRALNRLKEILTAGRGGLWEL